MTKRDDAARRAAFAEWGWGDMERIDVLQEIFVEAAMIVADAAYEDLEKPTSYFVCAPKEKPITVLISCDALDGDGELDTNIHMPLEEILRWPADTCSRSIDLDDNVALLQKVGALVYRLIDELRTKADGMRDA